MMDGFGSKVEGAKAWLPAWLPAWLAAAALLPLAAAAGRPARAQQRAEEADLGQLYEHARTEALARGRLRRRVAALPPVRMHTPRLDSLRVRFGLMKAPQEKRTPPPRLPRIRTRQAVRRLGWAAFEERFRGVDWAYLGANGRAVLDTMQTRALRARLQALYGDPTRTVVDADSLTGRPASDYIQFAYWFVVNDSIPVKIVDTGGPFDRGLVFAAPARFRERLQALRAAVFAPLLQTRLRARYVDYYFDRETGTWYRAGFDGHRFFARPVSGRDVRPGQRPVLRHRP